MGQGGRKLYSFSPNSSRSHPRESGSRRGQEGRAGGAGSPSQPPHTLAGSRGATCLPRVHTLGRSFHSCCGLTSVNAPLLSPRAFLAGSRAG